jgi:predicted Zn-dependent protease with MMP-like domain
MDWLRLLEIAKTEVGHTLALLPRQLRSPASQIVVVYLPRPDQRPECAGLEPDTLGLFVGLALTETEWAPGQMTPQIFLFLENLWEGAEGDECMYRHEVRRTLLHELGHYLGLEETDLDERDL